jgi:hypothetical protein
VFGRKKRDPHPDADAAGNALLDAFRAAGFPVRFVDQQRVGVQLADGSEAVTDISRYRAEVAGASPEALAAKAAEFVRLGAEPLQGAGHRPSNLRLRLYPEEMLIEPVRGGVVTRELAPGLWETVAIDRPDSVQPLPRDDSDDPEELFRVAIGNAVADEFTLTWFDLGDARVLHIGGDHPYIAAHVHVLGRYLDPLPTDGALVSFPLPEVVLVHPIGGVHPIEGLAQLQEGTRQLVEGGHKAISPQVFWWVPSAGERPDLRPVHFAMSDGRITVQGDGEFRQLVDRPA